MCELKMDAWNIRIIKHLPVKVNNRVIRMQEDANKSSKWSVFSIFFCKKNQKRMFYSKKNRIEFRSKCVNSEANFRPFTQPSTPAQV